MKILEAMANRQIHAILKGDILYTKDVFVPAKPAQESQMFDSKDELRAASALDELFALNREDSF